jgi:hypothetical protein
MMIALSEAVGRTIRCPDEGCGARSVVERSRDRPAGPGGLPGPPGTAPPANVVAQRMLWAIVRCPRTGSKLFAANTMVEVLDG